MQRDGYRWMAPRRRRRPHVPCILGNIGNFPAPLYCIFPITQCLLTVGCGSERPSLTTRTIFTSNFTLYQHILLQHLNAPTPAILVIVHQKFPKSKLSSEVPNPLYLHCWVYLTKALDFFPI